MLKIEEVSMLNGFENEMKAAAVTTPVDGGDWCGIGCGGAYGDACGVACAPVIIVNPTPIN